MINWCLKDRADGPRLMERDYPAQGVSPYHTPVCRLTREEAAAIASTRLVRWEDQPPVGYPSISCGDFISLEDCADGRLELRLRLPAGGPRSDPFEGTVPSYEAMLEKAASDSVKAANLIATTGIADARRVTAAVP